MSTQSTNGNSVNLLKNDLESALRGLAEPAMSALFQGYHPKFKDHRLGRQVEPVLKLKPQQQICYHRGKIFGGYLTFLMDRILADCCEEPAFTASLHTSFIRPVSPEAPMFLRAWPERVDGRKIYLKGLIQIPGQCGEWVDAITAEALFVKPRPTLKM